MSGAPRSSAVVASAVGFPVLAVARGVSGRPSIGGWAGADDAPTQVTLRYGGALDRQQLEITTYPGEPWEDFEELVGASFESLWQANRERDRWLAQRGSATEAGDCERDVAERELKVAVATAPAAEVQARSRERRRARQKAPRGGSEIRLETRAAAAHVIGGRDLWAAGFRTEANGVPLTALLTGRELDLELIVLKVITDLRAHLEGH
jgi:hypothetical protein